MGDVITIGVDLAKSVFQVHGVDSEGAVVATSGSGIGDYPKPAAAEIAPEPGGSYSVNLPLRKIATWVRAHGLGASPDR